MGSLGSGEDQMFSLIWLLINHFDHPNNVYQLVDTRYKIPSQMLAPLSR